MVSIQLMTYESRNSSVLSTINFNRSTLIGKRVYLPGTTTDSGNRDGKDFLRQSDPEGRCVVGVNRGRKL